MKTNEYRGYRSTTFMFVMLGFVTGTVLLVTGHIDAIIWKDGVLGLLTGFVVRSGIGSAAEAYIASKAPAPTAG